MIAIVFAQIRPGTPTGPGAMLREAIFFVTSSISSSAFSSFSLHSIVQVEVVRDYPGLSSSGGNTARSISAVSGGACGRSSFIIILYGHPHGSNSTDRARSIQTRALALLVLCCKICHDFVYVS